MNWVVTEACSPNLALVACMLSRAWMLVTAWRGVAGRGASPDASGAAQCQNHLSLTLSFMLQCAGAESKAAEYCLQV